MNPNPSPPTSTRRFWWLPAASREARPRGPLGGGLDGVHDEDAVHAKLQLPVTIAPREDDLASLADAAGHDLVHASIQQAATDRSVGRILVVVGGPSSREPANDYADFVHLYTDRLLRLAFVLTGHRQKAEDLAQEALLQTYRQWPKVQGAADQLAYVRKILINTYLADRRRKRFVELPFDVVGDTLSQANVGSAFPEQDAMLRAIGSLSRREQTVLVLRYYEDLGDASIAAAVGCRPATVRSLVHRAVKKLRNSPHLLTGDAPVRSE